MVREFIALADYNFVKRLQTFLLFWYENKKVYS
jgi:hypothetical protein